MRSIIMMATFYDIVAPTVNISQSPTQSDPSSVRPISFTANFSKPVGGLTVDSIVVSGTASATKATAVTNPSKDGMTWTITVDGMTNSGTVIASIPAGKAWDGAGNANLASTTGNTAQTDNVVTFNAAPTVTINQASTQADPTKESPVLFNAIFSHPVHGLTSSGVVLSGTANPQKALVTNPRGDGMNYEIRVSGMRNSGTVIASINVGAAYDDTSNLCTGSTSTDNVVTFTATGPTVNISKRVDPVQLDPATTAPIYFDVTFSEPVVGFDNTKVTLSGTAKPTTVAVVDLGDHMRYTVAVSGMTSSGTVIVSIPEDVVTNNVGYFNYASGTATVNYAPKLTVNINQAVDTNTFHPHTSKVDIDFTVVFSEPVTGFTPSLVRILRGSAFQDTDTPTVVIKEIAPNDGTTYDVKVSGMTSQGTVIATIMAGSPLLGGAVDTVGNYNAPSTSTDNTVYYDPTNPTVTVEQAKSQGDPTNIPDIHFTATFSEPVFGFTASGVNVTGPAGAVATVTPNADGKTFDIEVKGFTLVGTVSVSIPAGVAHSLANLPNIVSTSADNMVTYDNVAPGCTITKAVGQQDPTNVSPVNFVVTFAKPVLGFTNAGIILGGTAAPNTALVNGGGTTYQVAVSGMTKSGDVRMAVRPSCTTDAAGNGNLASITDGVVQYDNIQPTVTVSKAADQSDPAAGSTINFTVLFSKPVSGFTRAGVTLGGTALPASCGVVDSGDHKTFTVAVTGMKTSGTVTVSADASTVRDLAGNVGVGSSQASVTYNDGIIPTVTLSKAAGQLDPTNTLPIRIIAKFSKAIATFDTSAVVLTCNPNTVGATATAVDSGDHTTYNITVTGINAPCTVSVSMNAGAGSDAAGNASTASNALQVAYDNAVPSVTINKADGQADPAKVSPINFKVVFSKSVTRFTSAGIALSGTAGATTATVTGSGTDYTVAVSGMTKPGTVIATVKANAAYDSAGNGNTPSTSTNNTVNFDNSNLTVTVAPAANQKLVTNLSPVNFTVTFSKPVNDFTKNSVTLGGSAGGTKDMTITGSGAVYNVAVLGMTSSGTVVVDIAANACHDVLNNGNTRATYTTNSITYDITPPTVSITSPTSKASCTRNSSQLTLSGTAADDGGLAEIDWSTTAGDRGVCTGTTSWNVSGINIRNGQDTVTVTAKDAAGNSSTATLLVNVVQVSPGDAWKGLCMVSMPIIPDATDPKTVVSFAGNSWAYYNISSNTFSIYPDKATWLLPQTETPYKGFWARFGTTSPSPVGTIPDQTQPMVLQLEPGWNMIGQPFISPVAWDLNAIQVRIGGQQKSLADASFAGWITDYAWGWSPDLSNPSGGQYYLVYDSSVVPQVKGTLDPWRAYWIMANYECQLILPAP